MAGSEDVITAFDVWPIMGEAPLPVALFARVNRSGLGVVKRIWRLENGKKVREENDSEIINNEYREPGTFSDNLSIKLMSRGGDPAGIRNFTITVTTPKPRPNPIIKDVGQNNRKGFANQNDKVGFDVSVTGVVPAAIKDVVWDFGDETEESSRRATDITHLQRFRALYRQCYSRDY
jgi:hypothetical protein